MSNIYIQEPPTNGKVLLKTTVGDIDLELWSKETPKACRNFVQLCMEGYYNDTVFHRVVKGFIIQGGDPTGTGTGGESIYGSPFKDEFHSRLRFNRRGLLAMANAGQNDNASQFFFTLGPTPELQNKHTIFGKVTGETIFNMLKLEDALVDKDERPLYPQKIIKAEILYNPFSDIVPRTQLQTTEDKVRKSKKEKNAGVKNFKLLSFGEEAEEDEEESCEANRKYSGRSKSTHDILNDPHLSAVPAVEMAEKTKEGHKRTLDASDSDPALSEDEAVYTGNIISDRESDEASRIRKKLRGDRHVDLESPLSKGPTGDKNKDEDPGGDESNSELKRKADDIRKEIRDLKRELQSDKKRKAEEKQEREAEQSSEVSKNEMIEAYNREQRKYKHLKGQIPEKGSSREDFTMALLAKFQRKLSSAKEKVTEESDETGEQSSPIAEDRAENDDDEDWLTHKLKFESHTPVLAKDASTKTDDWFEIYDPRNPINKRRREASKDIMKSREKR